MRSTLAVAAVLVVAGCADAATVTLGGPDVGARAPDAGLDRADAAPLDAAATPGECGLGVVSLDLQPTFGAGSAPLEELSGRAVIRGWWPALELSMDDGRVLKLEGTLSGDEWPAAPAVAVVDVQVIVRRPFWAEVELSLRAPSIGYAFTAWSHSRQAVSVGEERPTFLQGACLDDSSSCGPVSPLHMNVSVGPTDTRFVPAGARLEEVGLTAVNARSYVSLGAPRCADAPTVWTAGFIERR